EPLALVASGDITGSGFKLDTSSGTSDGGDLFICAGCSVLPSGSALPPTPSLLPPPLVIKGGSASGGSIALSNYTVKTTSTNSGGSGGDIIMLAFQGATSGSGKVLFDGSISTGGTSTGANGNVTMVSGQSTGASLEVVGTITTLGGTGGGGNVNLVTAQPNVTGTVLPNGQFVPTTFGWGNINPSAIAATGTQSSPAEFSTAGNFTINAGQIDLFRDTKITSKQDVTLAAINDIHVGDETSGQNPVTIIAGSLTASGFNYVTDLYNGVQVANAVPANSFETTGSINVTTVNDSIELTKNFASLSLGESTNFLAGNEVDIDEGSHVFAIGGNINVQAGINPSGGS